MSDNGASFNININTINMNGCNMDMVMGDNLGEAEVRGEPLFIRNSDNVIRGITAVSNSSGSKITISQGISSSRWIITQTGARGGKFTFNLEGTNLYMTFPSGGDSFITLEPLRGFDNAQQFLEMQFVDAARIAFKVSSGGSFVSTQTRTVDVGTFLVVPTPGEQVFTAVLGTRPV